MSKEKSSPVAETVAPAALHGQFDPVARLRELPVIPSHAVPQVSPLWKPIPVATKQGFHKPADDQHAELKEALQELIKRREHLTTDLGRHAPDVRSAELVLSQLNEVETGRARARALLAFYEDKHDLLLHDGMSVVMKANRQIRNAAHDEPTIVGLYPKTVAISAQRSAAISEGMARRNAEKDPGAPGEAPVTHDAPA